VTVKRVQLEEPVAFIEGFSYLLRLLVRNFPTSIEAKVTAMKIKAVTQSINSG
jgi:hypothetical protein